MKFNAGFKFFNDVPNCFEEVSREFQGNFKGV